MIKKITSAIPVVAALITVIGIIKEIVYYNYFKLPIKDYLTISEIGGLIAEDILNYAWLAFSLIIIRILGSDLYERYLQKTKSHKFYERFALIMIALHLSLLVWSLFEQRYYFRIVIFSSIAVLTMIAVLDSEKGRKIFPDRINLQLIMLIVLVIDFEIVAVSKEIRSVIKGKYFGTKKFINETILISDKNSYYIGQTGKYIFLFNKDKTVTILSLNEVKKIQMQIK